MNRSDDEDLAEEDEAAEGVDAWLAKLPFEVTLQGLWAVGRVALIAVPLFFGLCLWMGMLVWIVLAATAGGFVGLLLGLVIGLDTQMDDFRVDLAKCFVAALFLVVPAWLMIRYGLGGAGLVGPVVVTYVVIKILWRDFVVTEAFVVEASMLLAVAFASCAVAAVVGG